MQHSRSRRTALVGLILQLLTFGALLIVASVTAVSGVFTFDPTLVNLALFAAISSLVWFAALLVFRQRELVELETLDLEQLKREKAAAGGVETIFEEEAGGFRVAEARLQWMERWLVPTFSLLLTLALLGVGVFCWIGLQANGLGVGSDLETLQRWGRGSGEGLPNGAVAMIVLSITLLCTFLYSRYASGMGRVERWQMLRGCGSLLLAQSILIGATIVAIGIDLYAGSPVVLHWLAYITPALLVVLGTETGLNFILDNYRPRRPGVERRAAFDSRLLALIAEPGGIASSIAEAVNYQFGFEVSKTWFYQLLQRAAMPLLGAGLLTLWLLTTIVLVEPYERTIIEVFGRQTNADQPLAAGLHFKWPWPIAKAQRYNVGHVKQMYIGFQNYGAEVDSAEEHKTGAVLWTQSAHLGQEHYDFIIPLSPDQELIDTVVRDELTGNFEEARESRAVPVNLMRMYLVLQYRIHPARVAEYTQHMDDPQIALRNLAWHEAVRYLASKDAQALLGVEQAAIGQELGERIQARVHELQLGYEIVYAGLQNIHPETTVSEAFRNVVNAEAEKLSSIREARVKENELLSQVAGDRTRALRLANAIEELLQRDLIINRYQGVLRDISDARRDAALAELEVLTPLYVEAERAQWRLKQAQLRQREINQDVELGLRHSRADREAASEALLTAERAAAAAEAALDARRAPLRATLREQFSAAEVDALLATSTALVAMDFWNAELENQLANLQGDAAVVLAQARALRWEIEMSAAAELARNEIEREAFNAAPDVYKARLLTRLWTERMRNSAKYVLLVDPQGRDVHVRYQAEEEPRPGLDQLNLDNN